MDVRKILVGFDGSESSKKAFAEAVDLARKLNASVTVLTVIHLPDFSPSMDEVEEEIEEAEKHYQPLLESLREIGAKNGILVNVITLKGHPVESLIKYAKEQKMDLIVIGTRGAGGFKKLLIGSVAQKIVSYSSIPVMVIRTGN
ncbi:MAG: universal stress protein [Desulfitobacteriaceae bacterium]